MLRNAPVEHFSEEPGCRESNINHGLVMVRIGAKRKSRILIKIIKLMSNSAEAIVLTVNELQIEIAEVSLS